MTPLVKKAALGLLRSTGAFTAAANSTHRRNRLLILCYHGVSLRDEHEWQGLLYITPSVFRRRLELLRDFRANVLPLDEGLRRLRERTLPPRSVVLTFDDGFHDFFVHGLPLLQEFGYPCTLYLTTHYCKYRLPIFNLIAPYLLWKSVRETVDLSSFGGPSSASIRNYEERRSAVESLLAFAEKNGMDTIAKDKLARQLAEFLGIDYDDLLESRMFQIMTPEEAAEVHRAGIDLQLHTHRHRTPRNRELFLREIRDNRDRIREFTGRDAVHFCYPSGDYAPEFYPWLRECGVESATTCDPELAAADTSALVLPRLLDHSSVGEVEFESWLCGLHR
jgi:peptidoglycan/xylan/chitin deacetylase (PgdA/CDA1 family)